MMNRNTLYSYSILILYTHTLYSYSILIRYYHYNSIPSFYLGLTVKALKNLIASESDDEKAIKKIEKALKTRRKSHRTPLKAAVLNANEWKLKQLDTLRKQCKTPPPCTTQFNVLNTLLNSILPTCSTQFNILTTCITQFNIINTLHHLSLSLYSPYTHLMLILYSLYTHSEYTYFLYYSIQYN